jgi:DHA3 family macrolide efflux protein-like MFS transporter
MKDNKFNNYIVFWISQSISQLGSSMTSFALVIWAYKETNSAMAVSLMAFFYYLPYIVVSIFAGTFIDRHKKKAIILWSDTAAAICSLIVLILVISERLKIWNIYAINAIIGLANSFQSPAETVAIGMMVSSEDYSKVSGMSSFSNSLLTVVTPMLAASVNSYLGLQGVILIDLLTFSFALIILLLLVRIPEESTKAICKHDSLLHGCREGMSFLYDHKGIWYMIMSMAFLNFLSRLTYENILTPMILARSGGNDNMIGIVSAVLGIGGIIGGLVVSARKLTDDNLKLIYFSAAFSFLFGDLSMGLGQNVLVWCMAAIAASVPIPFIGAGQNVIMYNLIPREVQGRVFAVKNAVQYCTIPAGLLLGGFLADYVFEPFMASDNVFALFLRKLVGFGPGSGMAVMFLCTGILGFITSLVWYGNKYIRSLQEK